MRSKAKQTLGALLACAMLCSSVSSAWALPSAASEADVATTSATGQARQDIRLSDGVGEVRREISLNGDWKFLWNGTEKSADPGQTDYDDSAWEQVTVPHCWNAEDGADGGNDYRRGEGWYRKTIQLDLKEFEGKQVYFECEALSQEADVYVNGTHVGNHKGGYTAFRYDITPYLKDGENVIAVRGDNSNGGMDNTTIAPIVGDFTVYGGMYRDVSLVVTDQVHVDTVGEPCDQADGGFETAPNTSGLYLTTTDVSQESATLTMGAKLVNDGEEDAQVTVTAVLRQPDGFEEIEGIPTPRFDVTNMGDGSTVETVEETVTIPAQGSVEFEQTIVVDQPRLWDGVADPFRYQVDLTVEEDGTVVDDVTDYVGFRYFEVKEDSGFYLNGHPYNLRGVSRHQDRPGQGYALSPSDHEEDFAMMYEMGVNSIRLAHYPQDDYMYELCDRYGIVVWAEIPYIGGNNNNTSANEEANELLRQTTKQQLRELILQNYNHPSILVWGLENEVGHQANADLAKDWIQDMNNLAHTLDPSRLTTMATNVNMAEGWDSDLIAWNKYPGWYGGNLNDLGKTMDSIRWHGDWRPVGISEYGAGANINQHEYNTNTGIPSAGGSWHPEEFQSDLHEAAIDAIKDRDYLWCTYVWNMFDFGSDGRNEGEQPGINDKGLVTFDRQTKKDSFYLYKANWNTWDPFVHITSSRDNPRYQEVIEEVKVYSNCDSVSITVNGGEPIPLTAEGNGVFSVKNVALPQGGEDTPNVVVATGVKGDATYTDTCEWVRQASNDTTLESDVLQVNNDRKTIGLTQEVTVEGLEEVLHCTDARSVWAFEQVGLTGVIQPGTRLVVTAEDGTTATYTFVTLYLNYQKPVTVSSQQQGNEASHAVDFNSGTRWAAAKSFRDDPGEHWLTVDLEDVYRLSTIRIDWFNSSNKRAYQYTVEVSTDGTSYTQVVDRSENTQQDSVSDLLYECQARYVRINVLGCTSDSLSASIYEVVINGWNLSSETLDIDHENRVITVDSQDFTGEFLPSELEELVEVQGDCFYRVQLNGGNYYLVDGDELVICGGDGREVSYAIDMPSGDAPVYGNLAAGRPVQASSYNPSKDYPSYVNDGVLTTRWAAMGSGSEGTVATFPQWITVDLGRVCDLSHMNLKFYKYDDGGRQYQYEVLVSRDGNEFTRVVDQRENTDPAGDFTHALNGVQGRYVKVNVTAADGGTWSLASIYELEVYGRTATGELVVETSLPDHLDWGDTLDLPDQLTVREGEQTYDVTVTWDAETVEQIQASRTVDTYTLTGTLDSGRIVTHTIATAPGNVVYFVDSGAAGFTAQGQILAQANQDTMLNQNADVAYSQETGWGYLNGETTSADHVTTGSAYDTVRNMTKAATGKSLSYQFDGLKAGTYNVYIGYQDPWTQWSTTRPATITLNQGETNLATLKGVELCTSTPKYSTMENVKVGEDGTVTLTLAPEKTGNSNYDMLVSYILIARVEEEPTHQHNLTAVEAKDPTCIEKGNIAYWYCEECGKYFSNAEATTEITKEDTELDLVPHTEETIPGKEATCTEDGLTEGIKCSVCGEILKAQETIEAKGHTEETIPGQAATCTEDGYTESIVCSVCKAVIKAQEIIKATGHHFENGVCIDCGAEDPNATLVDKSLLQKTYDYAKAQDTSNLVSSAKEKFDAVMAKAEAVLQDKNATQEQVNTTWNELVDVIHALGLVKGEKDMLELVVAQAEAMIDEAGKYVETNWKQLVDALDAAKMVLEDGDAMQGEVDEATGVLLDTILAQRFKANKDILEDLIGKAEDSNLDGYTAESVAVFRSALAQAQAILADESLSEDDQKTVDAAVDALSAAMDGLTAGGAPEVTDKPEATDQPQATDEPQGSQQPEATQKPENVPQTGDNASLGLFTALAVSSAGACAGLALLRRKQRR